MLISKVVSGLADLTIQRTQMRGDIRQILTDTQRQQMKQMREE